MEAIRSCGKPPSDTQQAIDTLLYVAPRLGVKELLELSNEWTIKFGLEYKQFAITNKFKSIDSRVVDKLSALPSTNSVESILISVASQYNLSMADSPTSLPNDTNSLQSVSPSSLPNHSFVPETCDVPVPAFAGLSENISSSSTINTDYPLLSFDQPWSYHIPTSPLAQLPEGQDQTNQFTASKDDLEERLAKHLLYTKAVAPIDDLVLPDVPHTTLPSQNLADVENWNDDFDLPDITPGHSSFTSSIRVVTTKTLHTNPTKPTNSNTAPELDELSSRLNSLKKK